MLPAELQRLIDAQKLPAGWNVAIIDSTGLIVARHPDARRWVGLPASNNLQTHLTQRASGFFESVTLDGVPSMAFFSKSEAIRLGFRDRCAASGVRPQPASIAAARRRSVRCC